ncbi:MAG: glycine--tRNA ligase [Nanoarchaeota archaeon]|nr:glycine--tRNA ligase [Nanoarchaeota archaeon]
MAHSAQDIATFCKKKGFMYPSSEIYGGIAGLYDYGHLGTKLKHNFEDLWRNFFLSLDDNFFEIEAANIMHENVFKASGHLENFIDPIVDCSKCDFSERADHFIQTKTKTRHEGLSPEQLTKLVEKHNLVCPKCGSKLKPVSVMNMMFPVNLGTGKGNRAYLRPETAQSPFVNFKLQYELQRKKLPLGLAVIGKAYRNEISPRNFVLRQREFTQAELQIFFNPAKLNEHKYFDLVKNYKIRTSLVKDRNGDKVLERSAQELVSHGLPQFYVFHMAKIQQFYLDVLKIPKEKMRFYELDEKERAFYNKYHFDIEIELQEFGFTEVGGLHYRTDHDLKGHERVSGEKMEIFDEESGSKFIPHVLELSFGVDRNAYSLLDLNYDDDKQRGNIVLHLPPKVTPFTCAVFPLVKNKPEITAKAEQVHSLVRKNFSCFYDEAASVGRRYARADEIGVKYCITIDFETLEDPALRDTVTIRNRDTTQQERVKISHLLERLSELCLID